MWLLLLLLPAVLAYDKPNCTSTDTLLCRSSHYDACYKHTINAVDVAQCYCDYDAKQVNVDEALTSECAQRGVVGGYISAIFGKIDATLILAAISLAFTLLMFIMQIVVSRRTLTHDVRTFSSNISRRVRGLPLYIKRN